MTNLEDRLQQPITGDDSFLYHYTSLSSACKIFECNSLKLSNLTNTNDPLEFLSPENCGFQVVEILIIRKSSKNLDYQDRSEEIMFACFASVKIYSVLLRN